MGKSKQIACIAFLFIYSLDAKAQEIPSIQTDRPDQTESPLTVPKHFLQIETGLSYERTNDDATEVIAPNVLTLFAINRPVDFKLI